MNHSEQLNELSTALAKAQAAMDNPTFDSVNPHFKSKFASLGAVLQAILPPLNAEGLTLSQWPISNGEAAGCRTLLAHSSGQWIEQEFLIPVDKHNAHGYASAVTYAKRIAAQSVAGVVGDTDDDANAAVGDNVKGEKKPPSASPAEFKKECFDSLPVKQQEHLRRFAADITAMVDEERGTDAYLLIEEQRFDDREKPALWYLLESHIRTAITKASEKFNGTKQTKTRAEQKGAH